MKMLKFVISLLILAIISVSILTITIKKSIPKETINTILRYAHTKYEMPEELEDLKNTEEYKQLEKEITNINSLLNNTKTKIVIKYLEVINSPTITSKLIISSLIVLIIGFFIYQNVYPVLINGSISSLLTGCFMLIAPSILKNSQGNDIINNLFDNFTKYGIYIVIISIIILFISITMSRIKE